MEKAPWIRAIAEMVHIIMLIKSVVNSTDDNSNNNSNDDNNNNNRYDFSTKRSICSMYSVHTLPSGINGNKSKFINDVIQSHSKHGA